MNRQTQLADIFIHIDTRSVLMLASAAFGLRKNSTRNVQQRARSCGIINNNKVDRSSSVLNKFNYRRASIFVGYNCVLHALSTPPISYVNFTSLCPIAKRESGAHCDKQIGTRSSLKQTEEVSQLSDVRS